MTIATQSLGSNSIVLNWTAGSTSIQMAQAVFDFLTTHGWVDEDPSNGFWTSGSNINNRTYSALNLDGITKKYMRITFYSDTSSILCIVADSYDESTKSLGNIAHNSNDHTLYAQRINYAVDGSLYLFASSHWCIIQTFYNGTVVGSANGAAWTGCFETTIANPEDDPAVCNPGLWLNGNLFYGEDTSGRYCVSPLATKEFPALPASASLYTNVVTPMGSWGYKVHIYGTYRVMQSSILPNAGNPWNTSFHAFDITLAYDNTVSNYVKGKVIGLKAISSGLGQLGDIIQIKVNSDNFTDNAGVLTDHYILTCNSGACRVAIPA